MLKKKTNGISARLFFLTAMYAWLPRTRTCTVMSYNIIDNRVFIAFISVYFAYQVAISLVDILFDSSIFESSSMLSSIFIFSFTIKYLLHQLLFRDPEGLGEVVNNNYYSRIGLIPIPADSLGTLSYQINHQSSSKNLFALICNNLIGPSNAVYCLRFKYSDKWK